MKIYTKTGDSGETGLFGGGRVPKDHVRVEAYGAVDEANAILGSAIAALEDPQIGEMLVIVQRELFEVGALLATPTTSRSKKAITRIADDEIERLERWIDAAEEQLPALRTFILPGGTLAGAALHHARTVVRRAERRTAPLVREHGVDASVIRYLNRLSDFLFVMARLANRRAGETEQAWSSADTSR